jgi:hypothetical protein
MPMAEEFWPPAGAAAATATVLSEGYRRDRQQ